MNNKIQSYFHSAKCLETMPSGVSPREWASLEMGWTIKGLQVWCKRHEMNVVALDFKGQKLAYDGDDHAKSESNPFWPLKRKE